MMSSDDDDVEPRLKAVDNYYFVDDNDAPISFDALPLQFDAAEEVPSFKKDVYLRGFTDGGLQKVYKQVVAWKLGLDGRSPEITVLSTEGNWIVLLKPRTSYEETVRSVLITVEMLHFLRRMPTDSEKNTWDHLRGIFEYELHLLFSLCFLMVINIESIKSLQVFFCITANLWLGPQRMTLGIINH